MVVYFHFNSASKSPLITRRGPDSKLAGYWEFPGGKVEEGETRRECLERELYEELGIQAHAGEEIAESEYHYDHGAFLIIAIEAVFDGDEIRPPSIFSAR